MDSIIFAKTDFATLLKAPKKGIRRQIQIANSTIELLHEKGLSEFSYEELASKCEISRGVIYSYFPKLENLLLFTSAYIRFQFQSLVIEAVSKCRSPQDMIEAYILSSLSWVDVFPKHGTIWLLFFHQCAVSEQVMKHNSDWVNLGTQRIEAIILGGNKAGIFHFNVENSKWLARHIQLLVTGGLISRATEVRSEEEWILEKKNIVTTAFSVLGVSK
ncbi:MAG: TetR/AcrR family transcriptional regulator [Bdellovibrionales bacterium]